jgi:hypothetical protein
VANTLALKNCCEHLIASVAAGSLNGVPFVMTHDCFRSPQFLDFQRIFLALIDRTRQDVRREATAALAEAAKQAEGVLRPLVTVMDKFLSFVPSSFVPSSWAQSLRAASETPVMAVPAMVLNSLPREPQIPQQGQAPEQKQLDPIGLPLRHLWVKGQGVPKWAKEFDFASSIKQTTTVSTLHALYESTLRPLDEHWGDGAPGVDKGAGWRSSKLRGGRWASDFWWKYSPLFKLFHRGASEQLLIDLQGRINRCSWPFCCLNRIS